MNSSCDKKFSGARKSIVDFVDGVMELELSRNR